MSSFLGHYIRWGRKIEASAYWVHNFLHVVLFFASHSCLPSLHLVNFTFCSLLKWTMCSNLRSLNCDYTHTLTHTHFPLHNYMGSPYSFFSYYILYLKWPSIFSPCLYSTLLFMSHSFGEESHDNPRVS